jgi:hypothetical protein
MVRIIGWLLRRKLVISGIELDVRRQSSARPGLFCQRGLERIQLLHVSRVQFYRYLVDTFSCPATGRMTLAHVLLPPRRMP